MTITVFVVCLLNCARNNPSEVAIDRWEACIDSILILDQALDSIVIADLPKGRERILNKTRKHYVRTVSSLSVSRKMAQQGCQIEGVRDYGTFRLYELHHFVRRLSEHSSTLEEIRERHLMVIGDLTNFDFEEVPQLTNEKLLVINKISPQVKYLITQSY